MPTVNADDLEMAMLRVEALAEWCESHGLELERPERPKASGKTP